MSKNVKMLTFSAICIALATVTNMVKLIHLPMGGSVTLCSMLFACLPGYFYGWKTGLISTVAYGILQFVTGPYIVYPLQVIVDYPLAFGALGLSGFFAEKKFGLQTGYAVGCLGRWLFSFLSGWLFFGEYAPDGWAPVVYSAVYNIAYIGLEMVITLVIISLPPVNKALQKVKQMANNQ